VLLPGVVLLDVEPTGEVHVAHLAPHVHLPGEVGHPVAVLPPLLVLLQVPRRHAQHAAEGARHGGLLLRRWVRWLGRRPSLEPGQGDGAGVHWWRGRGAAMCAWRRLRSMPRPLCVQRWWGRGAVGVRRRRLLWLCWHLWPWWPVLVLLQRWCAKQPRTPEAVRLLASLRMGAALLEVEAVAVGVLAVPEKE